MRIALGILIGLHGIIHFFGFLKAYGISEFKGINQAITKSWGLFWLFTFLLFVTAIVSLKIRSDYWWVLGIVAVVSSQILIFNYWSDAKYGTIANILILIAALLAYLNHDFKNRIKQERVMMFENSKYGDEGTLHANDLNHLPEIVQKWLNYSGVIGKQKTSNVFLTQDLQLKLKPEQEEWNKGEAEQYFTIQPPAFNWNINTEMNPLMKVVGRDKFENGKAEMLIKLFSLIPVADAKNHKKVNEAALQRYLAEIIWFPSASLSNYIQWEGIDEKSARATMEFNGSKGSGVFYFSPTGEFEKFVAMRFKDSQDEKPTQWTVISHKTEERNGIKIPVECEAIWNLESGPWTWLKLKIKHIEYNVEKMPVTNHLPLDK